MSNNDERFGKSNKTILWVVLGCGCGCGLALLILVGIGIIMAMPAIQAVRRAAQEMTTLVTCQNFEKQISLALHNYHEVYQSFPPAYTTDEDGNPLHSWRVLLLPYLEEGAMYREIRLSEPWDSEYNRQFHSRMPISYNCQLTPEVKEAGLTSYMRVVGPGTTTDGPGTTGIGDIEVGMSNVIWLVEVMPTTCWMAPVDIQESDLADNFKFGSVHSPLAGSSIINVGFLDATVQSLGEHDVATIKERVKIKR